MDFKGVIEKLAYKNLTISTMESCTGGGVANAITNCEGASEVLQFSAVTYSNDFKIKMGVASEIIEKYSVYSIETAREMSKCISKFSSSDIGVGITGKLKCADLANDVGCDNEVFVSIYYKDKFYDIDIHVHKQERSDNKQVVIDHIINKLNEII